VFAAFFSGVSKSGLAGMMMLGVTLMAAAVPGTASTGVVLAAVSAIWLVVGWGVQLHRPRTAPVTLTGSQPAILRYPVRLAENRDAMSRRSRQQVVDGRPALRPEILGNRRCHAHRLPVPP